MGDIKGFDSSNGLPNAYNFSNYSDRKDKSSADKGDKKFSVSGGVRSTSDSFGSVPRIKTQGTTGMSLRGTYPVNREFSLDVTISQGKGGNCSRRTIEVGGAYTKDLGNGWTVGPRAGIYQVKASCKTDIRVDDIPQNFELSKSGRGVSVGVFVEKKFKDFSISLEAGQNFDPGATFSRRINGGPKSSTEADDKNPISVQLGIKIPIKWF